MRTAPPLTAPLFRTAGQAAILAELVIGGETMTLSELAQRAGLPKSSASREVARLVEAGLLVVERSGRDSYVRSDPDSPLTAPVRQILTVAFGPAPMLSELLAQVDGVETAVLFGSFAARSAGVPGPPPRDIDVLVLGDPDARVVYAACRSVGEVVGRPVNATIMTPAEWASARGRRSAFATDVTSHPTHTLVGDF